MKRRGFLGFLAGGAVAGPGMVKEAAASAMEGLQVPYLPMGIGAEAGYGKFGAMAQTVAAGIDDPAVRLAKYLGRSAQWHSKRARQIDIGRLDPDIAAMRSIALHMKIRMQQDRTYAANSRSHRSWLERQIARGTSGFGELIGSYGLEDDDEEIPF